MTPGLGEIDAEDIFNAMSKDTAMTQKTDDGALIITPQKIESISTEERAAAIRLTREAIEQLKKGVPVYVEARDVFALMVIVKSVDDAFRNFGQGMNDIVGG